MRLRYTDPMGLFVEQNSNRSKLQEKLAAELNEKHRRKSNAEGDGASGPGQDLHDGVNDSAYMENTKQTTSLAWVWALIALVGFGIIVWLVFLSMNG